MHISEGITDRVLNIKSRYSVWDVIESILNVKVKAVEDWLRSLGISVNSVFVIGIYLTGFGLIRALKGNIFCYDKEFCLKKLVENRCEFKRVEKADVVIDTTGIGGVERLNVKAKAVLVESPISDGSDEKIKEYEVYDRLEGVKADYKGILRTHGLKAKTSGTMTLTLRVLRLCSDDVLKYDGVLYVVPAFDHYESLIFQKKDVDAFLKSVERPALTVSVLKSCSNPLISDVDLILEKWLGRVHSFVEDV